MSSRFRKSLAAAVLLACPAFAFGTPDATTQPVLRVCADPDNLPYSRVDGTGFENRIAELVAADLNATLRYEWMPLARGFVRKTLGAGLCDIFIGVPTEFERVATTRPYYRSSYVFVTRRGSDVHSFDDPRLRRSRVGVQLVGNDLAATPPGHALARAGATRHVVGFTMLGDGPAAERIVREIRAGHLDVGLVWGPQAGYFASRAEPPLVLARAFPPPELAGMPFEFSISMGVRRADRALRDALDAVIERRQADIDAILAAYHVPRTDRKALDTSSDGKGESE